MLRSVLRELFADLAQGRLQRIPFVLYILAVVIALLPLTLLFATLTGSLAKASGINLKWLAYPYVAVAAFVMGNLTAKRLRDIGLPGWATLVGLGLFGAAVDYFVSGAEWVFGPMFWLTVFFVPSDTLDIRTPAQGLRQ